MRRLAAGVDQRLVRERFEPNWLRMSMVLSLAALGPIYSLDYTWALTHPHGFLAKVNAPGPDIPRYVAGASWYEIPGIF